MFDRFTDRARKVMALARKEAQRFNHDFIGTEHILLGIIREGGGTAVAVVTRLGLELEQICKEVEKSMEAGPYQVTMGQLPFTPRAKRSLELAMEEATDLGHDYIGSEHLLLGLLREGDGVAGQALRALGLEVDTVRKEVVSILGPRGTFGAAQRAVRAGSFELVDAEGRVRGRFGFGSDGQPAIEFFDADGKLTWRFPEKPSQS
jgi:ATP-dependent Clp protease ATP-binding subunit ClpC